MNLNKSLVRKLSHGPGHFLFLLKQPPTVAGELVCIDVRDSVHAVLKRKEELRWARMGQEFCQTI